MIIPQFERIRAVANTPKSEVIHVARETKRGRQAGVSAVANAADATAWQHTGHPTRTVNLPRGEDDGDQHAPLLLRDAVPEPATPADMTSATPTSALDGVEMPSAGEPKRPSVNDDRHPHRRAHAHRAHAGCGRPGNVVVTVHPCGPAAALHQRCDGVAVHRSSGAHRPSRQRLRIGSGGHDRNLAIRSEAPQSGGVRRQASAHLLGHRAKYLQRFNAARHQRGEPAQGGLFGGEPAILGVQRVIVAGSCRIRQQLPRR